MRIHRRNVGRLALGASPLVAFHFDFRSTDHAYTVKYGLLSMNLRVYRASGPCIVLAFFRSPCPALRPVRTIQKMNPCLPPSSSRSIFSPARAGPASILRTPSKPMFHACMHFDQARSRSTDNGRCPRYCRYTLYAGCMLGQPQPPSIFQVSPVRGCARLKRGGFFPG